jgi:flagellar hook-associated protein 3 FlgL
MTLQPIGDLARMFVSRRQLTEVQAEVARRAAEVTTGLVADRGTQLKGDQTVAAALARDLDMASAFLRNAASLATSATALQMTLQTVDALAGEVSLRLLSPAVDRDGPITDVLAAQAREAFKGAVAALNTRVGGQTLLAGTATDGPATVDAETLLGLATAAATGQQSAADIAAAITAWFDDPAGFSTQAYLGGPARPAAPLAQGESAELPQTANEPVLRRTLAGLAIAALSTDLAGGGPSQVAAGLQRRAGEILIAGASDRTIMMADIGLAEERIAVAASRLQAETSALQRAQSDLLSADPYEAATQLSARQSQLETIYAVTARLSRLSLVEFLR